MVRKSEKAGGALGASRARGPQREMGGEVTRPLVGEGHAGEGGVVDEVEGREQELREVGEQNVLEQARLTEQGRRPAHEGGRRRGAEAEVPPSGEIRVGRGYVDSLVEEDGEEAEGQKGTA